MARRDVFDWLEEAREELKTSEQLYGLERYAHACFHAQQGAEKAFKALIIYIKKIIHRSHDLIELHNEVKDVVLLDPSVKNGLAELSAYYTQSRYPNAGLRRPAVEIGGDQAERALLVARGVVDAATRLLTSKV